MPFIIFLKLDDGQKRNKSIQIRLGWLYLDTIEVMERVTRTGGKVLTLDSMTQFENLERFFSDMGSEIAGVVTEFPTNPLLQSCDLEKVRSLCKENDSLLIIDPYGFPKKRQGIRICGCGGK